MTKPTRLFLVGAGSILVLGLGTGVIASYMGFQNVVVMGGGTPDELVYVPQDTRVLAFANVREVMDSELRAKIMALRPDGSDGSDQDRDFGPGGDNGFFNATGLDIERDIDSVLASVTGAGDQHPLVVAKGRFNDGLIESAILQHAGADHAKVDAYKGTRLIVFTEHNNSLAVAFAEPGVLVMGSRDAVERALDAKASGTNVMNNAEVMNLVRDSQDGNAWTVARFDELTGRAQLPQEISQHLPAITWLAAKGHVNGGLRATLRAETRDDASAQSLREVIRGVMALARLQGGQRAEFAELLNSIELGGTGKTVSLGFAVDSSIIDALGAMRHMVPGAPAMPPMPPADLAPPVL